MGRIPGGVGIPRYPSARGRGGQGRQNGSYYLYMMLAQLAQQISQMEYKPPITLGLMAINIGLHLNPSILGFSDPIQACCLKPSAILGGAAEAPRRLLMSAFLHGSDHHLYYNMASLLWKGAQLERRLGGEAFLSLCGVLLVLSHTLVTVAALLLREVGWFGPYSTCAVGFSAVLFGLKYVLNHGDPGQTAVMGIPLPTKHAAWLELLAIQLVVPNASFLGHLCGILAGVVCVHTNLVKNRPLAAAAAPPPPATATARARGAQPAAEGGRSRGGDGAPRPPPPRRRDGPSYTYASGTAAQQRYQSSVNPSFEAEAIGQNGLSQEDVDIQEALRRSALDYTSTGSDQQQHGQSPSATAYQEVIIPTAPPFSSSAEEIRRRRLQRFGEN